MCNHHNPSAEPTLLDIARVFGDGVGMVLQVPVGMLNQIEILLDVNADADVSRERVRAIADDIKANGYPKEKVFKCAVKAIDGVEKIVLINGATRMRALLLALSEGAQIKQVPARVKLNMKWADPAPAITDVTDAAGSAPNEAVAESYAHIAVCGRFVDMEAGQAMTNMFSDSTAAAASEQYVKEIRDWARDSDTPSDQPVAMVAVSSATHIVEAYGSFTSPEIQQALGDEPQPYLAVIGSYEGSEKDKVLFFCQRSVENARKLFVDTMRSWTKDSAVADDHPVSVACILVSLTPLSEVPQRAAQ